MSSFGTDHQDLIKELSSFGGKQNDTTKRAVDRVRMAVRLMPSTFRGQGSSQTSDIAEPDKVDGPGTAVSQEKTTTPPSPQDVTFFQVARRSSVTTNFALFRRGSMKSIVNTAIESHALDRLKAAMAQDCTTTDEERPPHGAAIPPSPTPSFESIERTTSLDSGSKKGPSLPLGPLSPSRAPKTTAMEALRDRPGQMVLDLLFDDYGKRARPDHLGEIRRTSSVDGEHDFNQHKSQKTYRQNLGWMDLRSVVAVANGLPPIDSKLVKPSVLLPRITPRRLKTPIAHEKSLEGFQRTFSQPAPSHLFHRGLNPKPKTVSPRVQVSR
jgi:hypothetical protein